METTHQKESTMLEIWKDIPEYEGFYQVSNMGQVRSLDREIKVKDKRTGFRNMFYYGKIIKPTLRPTGYYQVTLRKNKAVSYNLHRLVLITFRGYCPVGYEACHNNGIKTENQLYNLRWDTRKSNRQDAIKHGSLAIGEKNGNSKYSNWQIRVLKRCLEFGLNPVWLSEKIGISAYHIRDIKKGKVRIYA